MRPKLWERETSMFSDFGDGNEVRRGIEANWTKLKPWQYESTWVCSWTMKMTNVYCPWDHLSFQWGAYLHFVSMTSRPHCVSPCILFFVWKNESSFQPFQLFQQFHTILPHDTEFTSWRRKIFLKEPLSISVLYHWPEPGPWTPFVAELCVCGGRRI